VVVGGTVVVVVVEVVALGCEAAEAPRCSTDRVADGCAEQAATMSTDASITAFDRCPAAILIGRRPLPGICHL
jgi:hypothetical protein